MKSESRGPSRRRFQAALRTGGKISHLGYFTTREERDLKTRSAREQLERTGRVDAISERRVEESEDPWLPPTRRTMPEARLCAAVMLQAYRDLMGKVATRRRRARAWVMAEDVEVGDLSFRLCCDVLGFVEEHARQRMLGGDDAWHREPSGLRLVKKDSIRS